MRKVKKVLTTVLLSTALCSCVLFTSCGSSKEKVKFDFDLDGGDGSSDVNIEKGKEYTLPTPTKAGYSFEGWYTNPTFEGEPVTSIIADENTTVYAKWVKLYTINVDLNGGSLENNDLSLKANENLYDYMQGFKPTYGKTGVEFAYWAYEDAELAKDTKMPSANVSLVAKYKVKYTEKVETQKYDKSGYEETTVEKEGLLGEEISFETPEGFHAAEENDSDTFTLTDDVTKNEFTKKYDRNEFTVKFNSNYPAGSNQADQVTEFAGLYGDKVTAPNLEYVCNGYALVGWSTKKDGSTVDYATNLIDSLLYNSNKQVEAQEIAPTDDVTLYAVWQQGYTDTFGGDDIIFVIKNNVYLYRGGIYISGTLNPKTKEFSFANPNKKTILTGGYDPDTMKYFYSDSSREGVYSYYSETGVDKDDFITLDALNGASRSIHSMTSYGTYVVNDDGTYTITYTSGALQGESQTVYCGESNGTKLFLARNEDEFAIGTLLYSTMYQGQVVAYNAQYYSVTFDGFGYATYAYGSQSLTYYYEMIDDTTFTLTSTSNELIGTYKIVEVDGNKCYYPYDSAFNRVLTVSDGSVLTLDGTFNATVIDKNNNTSTGIYSTTTSVKDNTEILTVTMGTASTKYLLTYTYDSTTKTYSNFKATLVDENYNEFFLVVDGNIGSVLIVRTGATEAELYALTSAETYVKVSTGTLAENEDGSFAYTVTSTETKADGTTLNYTEFDLYALTTANIGFNDTDFTYPLTYFFDYTTATGTVESNSYSFTEEYEGTSYTYKITDLDGLAQLYITSDAAGYTPVTVIGLSEYNEETGLTTFTFGDESIIGRIGEDGSFTMYYYAPFSCVLYTQNGELDQNVTLNYDGLGHATYEVKDADGKVTSSITGTISLKTDENGDYVTTDAGQYIYVFTSEDTTFTYLEYDGSSASYFFLFDDELNGEFNGENGQFLYLDGYGFGAYYIDENGDSFDGMYSLYNDLVVFYGDEQNYLFELDTTNHTLNKLGNEYGIYLVDDNGNFRDDLYYQFDGKGGLKLATVEDDKLVYTGTGTYTNVDGTVTCTYTVDGKDYSVVGNLTSLSDGTNTYSVFVVQYLTTSLSFVNPADYSVLKLDELGNGYLYDNKGNLTEGSYTFITNGLLSYSDGETTTLYNYDTKVKSFAPIDLEAISYYTSDLAYSLTFNEGGYVLENGEFKYYYVQSGDTVYMYEFNPTDAKANNFGYVEKEFGSYTLTKTYEDHVYYQYNNQSVVFERSTDSYTSVTYKKVQFELTGDEFTVEGTITLDDDTIKSCSISRVFDATTNTYKTYLYVDDDKAIGITINFLGEDQDGGSLSTFTVDSMAQEKAYAIAYSYFQAYEYFFNYYVQLLMGYLGCDESTAQYYVKQYYSSYVEQDAASYKSVISFMEETTSTGEINAFISSSFGEYSGICDSQGNAISLTGATCTFEPSGTDQYAGTYVFTINGADGFDYKLYVEMENYDTYYVYYVYGFTRVQTVTLSNGYTALVETLITTDLPSADDIYSIVIKNGETVVVSSEDENVVGYTSADGEYTLISRTLGADGKVTATIYYVLGYTLNTRTDEDGYSYVTGMKSIDTYAENTMTTVYSSDSTAYVDMDANGELYLISINGKLGICTYDETNSYYTVRVYNSDNTQVLKYKVEVVNGVLVVTLLSTTDVTTE